MKWLFLIGGLIFAGATINAPILSVPTLIGSVILLITMVL